MAVEKISKIAVFGSKNKKELVLEELQKTGMVQIISDQNDDSRKKILVSEVQLKKLVEVLEYLESKANESFMEKNKIQYVGEIDFFEGQKTDLEENLAFTEKIWNYLHNVKNLTHDLEELQNLKEDLSPWQNFNISLDELKNNVYFSIFVASISKDTLSLFKNNDLLTTMDYDVIHSTKENVYAVFSIIKTHEKETIEYLKSIGALEYTPIANITNKSCYEIFSTMLEKMDSIRQELKENQENLDRYITSLAHLRLFYDYLNNKVGNDIANTTITETDFIFTIKVFIAKHDISRLEELLNKIEAVDYEEIPLEEGEEKPSLIRNGKFASSFEFVTAMYSLPGKNDPDPTPFFAPFFALFMGFCIGDAGQGLLLALASLFIIKKLRISPSMKKLLQICFYGGIASIFVGIMTGSYFAIPFENFGITIPKLYDPAKQIMLALGIAISLGFVHVLLGFLVKMGHLWKTGDKFGSIVDGFSKVLVMLGGLFATLGFSIKSISFMLPVGTYTACTGAVIILFTSGRHEADNIFGKLMWGFYGVYELTGIFGDLLSYARLFALGLSGGIIGNAINTLTPRLISGISFHGVTAIIYSLIMIVVFLLILIIGHLFTMMLAVLGGFIHTMRLQFVEFFTKFFEGGSDPFIPFNIQSKYFWIKHNKKSK